MDMAEETRGKAHCGPPELMVHETTTIVRLRLVRLCTSSVSALQRGGVGGTRAPSMYTQYTPIF